MPHDEPLDRRVHPERVISECLLIVHNAVPRIPHVHRSHLTLSMR